MTRPYYQVEQVLRLHAVAFNRREISRMLGIPRGTIRDWLDPRKEEAQSSRRALRPRRDCQRCLGIEDVFGPDYVYMLGLYLGDGHLACSRKGVWRLRIFQDQRYSGLINECRLTMSTLTLSRVRVTTLIGCVEIGASWKHWIHLFPQHGAGPKWLRPIVMEPWQRSLISRYPAQLVRGLVHSDGCRFINRVRGPKRREGRKSYEYVRYMFTNMSDDIRLLFTATCDLLGVHWTQTNAHTVAVSRRRDVEFLDTFIGPKS